MTEYAAPNFQRFLSVKRGLTAHFIVAGSTVHLPQAIMMNKLDSDDPEIIRFERQTASWHTLPAQKFRVAEDYFDGLALVIEEVAVPFAREYFTKHNRQMGMHRLYVAVQGDDAPGLLLASYAVREDRVSHSWDFGPCYHINHYGQWTR